jgi:hypothetical protein
MIIGHSAHSECRLCGDYLRNFLAELIAMCRFRLENDYVRRCPSGSIKGDVKKKHSSSSTRRGCFSDIQPPSAHARILAEAQLGRTDFAGGCGVMN